MMTSAYCETSCWRAAWLLLVVAVWLCAAPPAWAAKTGTLYELIQNGTVEMTTAGSGIQSVAMKVRRKVEEPVTVSVPVGTFFYSGNAGSQNMVTVGSVSTTLTDNDWHPISVPTACANRSRDIPSGEDSFTVQQSPQHADLEKVIPLMEKDGAGYAVKQAAVWIITDNATYSDLGILVSRRVGSYSGGSRVIDAADTARAMKYCAQAGIDLTRKAIWRDRGTVFPEKQDTSDVDLMDELRGYNSTGVLVVTTTPPGAVVSVTGVSTRQPSPCRLTVGCNIGQPRKVTIQSKQAGYYSKSLEVTVTAGADTPCEIILKPFPVIPAGTKLGEERTNPLDGAALVWVPAGEFLMGSKDGEGSADECPQRTIYLDGYWINKTEVTVAQYRKYCQATGRTMPSEPSWKWSDDHPIVNVSWEDASAYAEWAGAALPTEAQWEKAARGTDGRVYPWGNDWDASKAQCSKAKWGDANTPAAVGSFPAGTSPYGCLDMAGNVWEWCADWYDAGYYKTAPARNPPGPATGTSRVLRGGSWDFIDPGDFRAADRGDYFDPSNRGDVVGFRCVLRSPGP